MWADTEAPNSTKGFLKTIADLVKSSTLSKGFIRLMEYNMPEYTLENLMVENDHDFSDGIVESALDKLVNYA
mgnify:FL=1